MQRDNSIFYLTCISVAITFGYSNLYSFYGGILYQSNRTGIAIPLIREQGCNILRIRYLRQIFQFYSILPITQQEVDSIFISIQINQYRILIIMTSIRVLTITMALAGLIIGSVLVGSSNSYGRDYQKKPLPFPRLITVDRERLE